MCSGLGDGVFRRAEAAALEFGREDCAGGSFDGARRVDWGDHPRFGHRRFADLQMAADAEGCGARKAASAPSVCCGRDQDGAACCACSGQCDYD